MNHRQPPPPPHQYHTTLPPPRHLPSRGETDITYDAYSPSPSSLSAHRDKYNRIQDWAIYNTLNRPRIGGSGMLHDPSMGLGSASWSDTGTGITEDNSDLGTVPTTVKDGRGVNGSREKVDVRKAMSATKAKEAKGLQRKPSRLREELDVSELPYRQTSIRRDTGRPPANGSAPDKQDKSILLTSAPQRPMLHHSKSTKPAPTPALAKPPTPPKDRITPETIFVTSPESDNGKDNSKGRVMSPYAIREAYLESALTLPIDMLSQVQRDKHLQTPGPTLKGAKSVSSISSGVTATRLASLLGKGSPKDGNRQLQSGTRQLGSSKTVGGKPPRSPIGADKVETVRQAKSTQAKAKPPTANIQEIPRSLGSAPALGRSTTVPANTRMAQPSPVTLSKTKPSALGLDLGPIGPIPNTELRPAPHRQLSALRRPALTPGSSAENLLAAANTLGRRSRDPSMTDLKTRFEPATYPLPESKSSVGTRRTEVTDEETSGKGVKKGRKGGEAALADVTKKKQGEGVQGPKTETGLSETRPPVIRQSTPQKSRRPSEPVPPPIVPDTTDFVSPTPPDFILTPPAPTQLPLDRHTLPRGITSRVAHDDRVSFEVPNGTRGRLRVSLAWVRDRATRSNTFTPSDAPPPLPPKSPSTRHHFRNRGKHRSKEVRKPSPVPSVTTSAPHSPKQPQAQVYHDPYLAQSARPPYPQVGMNGFQPGPSRPLPYPQPQPWASMPHLGHQQAQMQGPPRYGPHLAQSAESFEPPSARQSPIPGMMSLPNVGMGMGMPMGIPMGMGHQGYGQAQGQDQGQGRSQLGRGAGMQNGMNPYSNPSFAQQQQLHNQDQTQHQGWQEHDQQQPYQGHTAGYGQAQGQGQGQNPYSFLNRNNGQDGNRQSIWKRMFNGNLNNSSNQGNGNQTGYRVPRNAQGQYEQHDDYAQNRNQTRNQNQDQVYRQQRRGTWGGGNDRIGRWMRTVTPGKRPPGEGATSNTDVRDRKNYNLTQPFFGRRRQYDGPINDETIPRIRERQTGGGRQGGMRNWLSTLQSPGNGRRLQSRRNQYGDDYYQTNRPRQNLYGNDPFQSDRDAKRRQKVERRNEREDRARRQVQAQAQGRRGQKKWKDRLPRKTARTRGGQDTHPQGQRRGTTGMGVLGSFFR